LGKLCSEFGVLGHGLVRDLLGPGASDEAGTAGEICSTKPSIAEWRFHTVAALGPRVVSLVLCVDKL
jgi:hypothetical protein